MGEDGLEHVGVILLKESFVVVGMWMGEAVIVVGLAVLPVTSTENPEPRSYSVFFSELKLNLEGEIRILEGSGFCLCTALACKERVFCKARTELAETSKRVVSQGDWVKEMLQLRPGGGKPSKLRRSIDKAIAVTYKSALAYEIFKKQVEVV